MKYLAAFLLFSSVLGLLPRQPAPYFSAKAVQPDLSFKTVSLSDFLGEYVVLLFYPFDFTYVCPTQIIAYSAAAKSFKDAGATVLAISVDSHFSHLAWRNTPRQKGGLGHIEIALVADITKGIARSYGVLVEDADDGLNGASLRGVFVIDTKGMIRSVTINDEQVGRNPEQTLRTILAFQHADKFGVVCPSGWTPGAKTIVPDQEKMQEYFREL